LRTLDLEAAADQARTCFAALASALISALVFGAVSFAVAASMVTLTISTTSITTSALSTLSKPLESALQPRHCELGAKQSSRIAAVEAVTCEALQHLQHSVSLAVQRRQGAAAVTRDRK